MEKILVSNIENFIASRSLKEEVKNALNENDSFIIALNYTDYGGSFADRVVIEWCKKYHPTDILFERTSWDGQNAAIIGETARKFNLNDWYYSDETISDMYDEMQNEMIEVATNDICDGIEFDTNDVSIVRGAIKDSLAYNGHPEPNVYDYNDEDIIENAQTLIEEWGYAVDLDKYFFNS